MYGDSLFSELSLVVAIGAAMAMVMRFLKQPLIIGHIITGIIVGPVLLNIIHDETGFSAFSSLGIALLLFIVGLELSLKVLARLKRVVTTTAVIQITSITLLGLALARLLDFSPLESVIIGLALAMSSTIIIIKIFNDKKELGRLFAQIAIGVLLLQDLVATAGKILLAAQHESDSLLARGWLIGRGLLVVALLYLASKYLLPRLTRALESSKELLLLFSLGWALGLAALFVRVGFSLEVGALLAGVSLASLPYSHEMASRLKPLRDFFIVIFFITIGASLVPDQLSGIVVPAILFSLLVFVAKPLSVLVSLGWLGYTKRASFKAAISMSQISEFSLVFVVAAAHSSYVSPAVQQVVSLVALITFAGSAYLMKYDDQLYQKFEKRLHFFERRTTRFEQRDALQHYPIVLFGYRKGGAEFIRTFKNMRKRFVVIDYDPEVIDTLERQHLHLLYGDATDPELIEEAQLDKAKLVISTITDYPTNEFLAHWLANKNPNGVFICSAETTADAARLYTEGAAYVMLPHFIGSEKISNFLKKSGFKKSEFHKFRDKHLQYLQTHYAEGETET